MRLKTIEIKGFKSFAEKTIINFSEPVIGVVGSNGCGKSNIVDAIRWVLGEQKTSALRSESMTNVIFNGTKSKAAAGLAEVSLVFENHKNILPSEYHEVAIKRVLYKDGTGEYYLNQVRCRLKDIHNLLQNTGISSDSYAIIALSMVDDLLQDKENARLALFEQAAGIASFKGRKKETLSKLKATDEDLARIEDLLAEIEKNMLSLEKQANRTRKYLQMKTEYRELSLELARFQVAEYKENYKLTEARLQAEEEKTAKTNTEIEAAEASLRRAKAATAELEQKMSDLQQRLGATVSKIKNREADQKMLTQKTWFLQDNQQKLQLQLQEADTKTLEYQERIRHAETQLASEQSILALLQSELQAAQTELSAAQAAAATAENNLAALRQEAEKAQNTRFELEKNIAITQAKIDQAQQRIQNIQAQADEQQAQQRQLLSQIQEADTKTLQLQNLLKNEKELQEDTIWQINDTQEKLEQLRETRAQRSRQYDAFQNQHKLLRELAESLEGHAESAKFLAQNKDWLRNNAVIFSDVVSCQPEFRAAIENYLEPFLSHYIVPNASTALQAIQLLQQHKKGKANFFLLDQVPATPAQNANVPSPQAVAAINIIQAESQYLPLLQELLHNVFLVPTAQDVPPNSPHTFISYDGQYTQKAFYLRGGAALAFEGKKIGRKQDLQELQTQIEALKTLLDDDHEQIQKLQTYLQQLRQINHAQNIQHLEQQINQWHRQTATAKSKLDNLQEQQQQADDDSHQQQKLIRIYQRDLNDTQTQLQATSVQAEQARQKLQQEQAQHQSLKSAQQELSQAYNQKNINLIRQQNTLTTLQQDIAFAQQQIHDIAQRTNQNQSNTNNAAQELLDTEKQIAEIQIQLQELYDKKLLQQQQVEAAEQEFFKHRGTIQQQEEAHQQLTRQYQQQLQLINQYQNAFAQTKLQLSTLAERIRIEFEISINEVVNQDPDREMFDPVELAPRVETLRQRLQNYGAVNYMAIEAYDETKTRFDFISEQRDDLLKAKETLLATLREIEGAATELFMTAFTTVRAHFISVFRSLFEADDTCDLVLSNPASPLESRIEIVAKPKGKKPLSINQLSGGEKTLTATALLFALYLLKPAPFCIFDEVDAPLDDANIAKFNNIIRDFSQNSQFIVVTHNKKTMESVNIMYGVTMVEGISRVVPVDFRALSPAE